MELPRETRPLGNKGRKATHDFLSLYSSPVQQDPTPSQGGYLKTHDFLQPLEVVGKNMMKEDNRVGKTIIEKPLPQPSSPSPSVEHILPGGIGTYSISYLNNQRCLKPEGSLFTSQSSNTTRNDENSNCSSYSGSGFTLWDESAVKQGKTGKENISAERHVLQEAGINVGGGQWPAVMERRSGSPSNNKHTPATFSSFSSSQPSSYQKNQSFMDMITSAKNDQEEDEDDDDDEEFNIKKEHSSHTKGNFPVKVEAKTMDQKPNTPRSKHSATEQRRRSKINDRFQKLREIIPNSDQKRDKASFLLEVIEYIQFLQEKVTKCDSPYPPPWNHEPTKMMQWNNRQMAEAFMDPTRVISVGANPGALFVSKSEDNKACLSPATPANGQTIIDSDMSTATTFKQRGQLPELTSKETPVRPPVRPNMFAFGRSISAPPVTPKQTSDVEKAASWPPPQILPSRPCAGTCTGASDKLKEDITIESGTINISSVYSQRLLSSLTQALQSSGVDLSQANISVQIDLGKTRNGITSSPVSNVKDNDVPASLRHSRVGSTGEEYDHALKRLRTS